MGMWDDAYKKLWDERRKSQVEKYNEIIEDFKSLSLEEKVNKLIEIYACESAYDH